MSRPWSRRGLLLGAAGCLFAGAASANPARVPWGVGVKGELIVVFAQERPFGPGVPAGTLRALVRRGPPALAGSVSAYGLRVVPATTRAQRRPYAIALAVIAAPPKVIAVDGQFLLPTLGEALRTDLSRQKLEEAELDDGLFARVLRGEHLDPNVLLVNARRLAIQAAQAPGGDVVLRVLGYAQLAAWSTSPPEGYAG